MWPDRIIKIHPLSDDPPCFKSITHFSKVNGFIFKTAKIFHQANYNRMKAKTIAKIYKQRWQVKLLFKWIKQNLKIKSFLGNNDNAVMTQVMIALCIYLI